jgi:hypothetical protein
MYMFCILHLLFQLLQNKKQYINTKYVNICNATPGCLKVCNMHNVLLWCSDFLTYKNTTYWYSIWRFTEGKGCQCVSFQDRNTTKYCKIYGSQPEWLQQKMYLCDVTAPSVKCTQYGDFHRAFFILCIDFKGNDTICTLLK